MSKKNYKKYEYNKKEFIKKEEAEDLAKDLSDTEAVEDLKNVEEPVEEIKKIIEDSKPAVTKKVKSNCRLNLRMEDSKDSSVMAILEPNTEVLELEKNGEWSYIKVTMNGLTMNGFVMNTFLQ